MTIEQTIEQRRQELQKLEFSEDVKRYRLLEYQIERLTEVRDMLRMEAEVAKAAKPKPAKPKDTRVGSLANVVSNHLAAGHAFGMALEELAHHTGYKPGKLKRAIEPYLGSVFGFDFVSGLYSLKSREAERVSPVASNGDWANIPPQQGTEVVNG